jgi:hypothetical protein
MTAGFTTQSSLNLVNFARMAEQMATASGLKLADPPADFLVKGPFNSMGEAVHAKGTVEGDTWTWTSTEKMGGKIMKGRFTITVASPTSYSFKFEMAPDGTSDYTTNVEGKSTKVVAANLTFAIRARGLG